MKLRSGLYLGVAAIAVTAFLAGVPARLDAQQNAAVSIGNADLGGVVTSPHGPEAGVWVIAETSDLPTKMVKIVVTDDQGRYVLPDLPKANYDVWVRGYGLVDSPKVKAQPGKILNLAAVPAPNDAAAAEYYPPIYWLSMVKIPQTSEFPGTGHGGNGINERIDTQSRFLSTFKTDGCFHCHAIGTKATRTIPKEFGTFANGYEAWTRRIQSGQASKDMVETIERFGTERGLKMLGDWTDQVAAGAIPATKPPRPQGLERNVVITVWDWADLQELSPRRDFHRQAQSHSQCLWVALRGDREQHRQCADPRSREEYRHFGEDSGPRSEDAVGERYPDVRALCVLGRRTDLERSNHPAQPDAG